MNLKRKYLKHFSNLNLEYGDVANLDKEYRKLAIKNHPDKGGNLVKMQEINKSKNLIDEALKKGIVFKKIKKNLLKRKINYTTVVFHLRKWIKDIK